MRPPGWRVAAAGATVVLWVVALVHFRGWIAHNDFAIFRIDLERQLDGDPRLVGAYSRLGVFHPGPLREWLFAGPYWLSGRRAAALPATSLLLNVGWICWTLLVARRIEARVAAVSCIGGLLALVIAVGPNLASPWNPHLAILPLYLALCAVVVMIATDARPWAAALCGASFAAQAHASALIVGGVLIVLTLATVMRTRTGRIRPLAISLTVGLWIGPLLDLRHGRDANLVKMIDAGSEGDSVGLGSALGYVSRLLWPPTVFAGTAVRPSAEPFVGFFRGWLLLVVAALVAVVVVVVATDVAHRATDEARSDAAAMARPAGLVSLAGLALAIVSISLFVEPPFRYLFGPMQAVAVLALVVVVAAVLVAVDARLAVPDRAWQVAAMVSVAAIGGFVVTVPADDHESAGRRALGVEPAVATALDERPAWSVMEVVGLDLRAAIVDVEIADIALRRGLDVRSRRFELATPAPRGDEPLLVAAMGESLTCLRTRAAAGEEIVSGEIATTGAPVGVFALERDSAAAAACLRGS